MNRWRQAAVIFTLIAAISNSSPVLASLNGGMLNTETAAIRVAKNFPADMASNISTDSPLTVEFGGAVNQSFYKSVNLNLFQGTTPVKGDLYYNPSAKQIMFKAKQTLDEGKTYTAQLSYFDGLGRTSEKVWSFRTMGGQNNIKPVPVNMTKKVIPTANNRSFLNISNASMGSGFIKPGTVLKVTFSEPLDIATLKAAPVRLFANNKPIGVDYKLSRDLKTITINPRRPLTAKDRYAVAINTTLSSSSGSVLRKKTLIPFKVRQNDPSENITVDENEIAETPASFKNTIREKFSNPFANTRQASRPGNNERKRISVTTAPPAQVVGLAPRNGSRVTNITQPVTIAFNEEIRPETLNEFTFRLEDEFGPVPARIHYFKGSKQATLTPVGSLESNKTYRVVVTQGITDIANRPIKTGITSKFIVSSPISEPAMPTNAFAMNNRVSDRAAPNVSPVREARELENLDQQPVRRNRQTVPAQNYAENRQTRRVAHVRRPVPQIPVQKLNVFKVAAVYPGADSNKVSRRSKIAVHFSEPADSKTINNINISVFGKQRRVDGKVIYDRKKNRAIFEPSRPLDANTQYKVIVSSKVKSKYGESLGTGFSWQFVTTKGLRRNYIPRRTAEADAAFYIPLVDGKVKQRVRRHTSNSTSMLSSKAYGAFNFVDSRHWAFKTVKYIANRGMLDNYPFTSKKSVTRYEFASAVNMALNNLKSMQNSPIKPKLRVADLVKLEELVIEFRKELRSYGVNSTWFERFLSNQGVDLNKVRNHVIRLNG